MSAATEGFSAMMRLLDKGSGQARGQVSWQVGWQVRPNEGNSCRCKGTPILTGAGGRRQKTRFLRSPKPGERAPRTRAREAGGELVFYVRCRRCHSPPGIAATCPDNSSPVSEAMTVADVIPVRVTTAPTRPQSLP